MFSFRSELQFSRCVGSRPALLPVVLWAALALLAANAAHAIDGNYASPYASQWDTRSTAAMLPDETLLGLLLLALNVLAALFFFFRDRRRRRRQSS